MARVWDGSTDMRITYTMSAGAKAAFTNGGSLVAWLRPDTDGGGNASRFLDCANDGTHGFFGIISADDGTTAKTGFVYRGATNDGFWETTSVEATLNAYSSIGITYDASDENTAPLLYVNGVSKAVTESAAPGSNQPPTANVVIGNNYSSSVREFDGDISFVCLWNIVLTASELLTIARGVNPFFVRNDALVWYSPIWGNLSPEAEYITPANTGTVLNAPPKSTNPAIEQLENNM